MRGNNSRDETEWERKILNGTDAIKKVINKMEET